MTELFFGYVCYFVKILGTFFFAGSIGREMIEVSRSQKRKMTMSILPI